MLPRALPPTATERVLLDRLGIPADAEIAATGDGRLGCRMPASDRALALLSQRGLRVRESGREAHLVHVRVEADPAGTQAVVATVTIEAVA